MHDLFNQLTGSSRAPGGTFRRIAVAPESLLPWLLGRIEQETAHARAGRPARIRAKLNGLADTEVIQALYGASRAGVAVDLVVRGLCTLRPGIPGHSDRIRVVSRLGRFLEHGADLPLLQRWRGGLLHRVGRLASAQPAPADRGRRAGDRR